MAVLLGTVVAQLALFHLPSTQRLFEALVAGAGSQDGKLQGTTVRVIDSQPVIILRRTFQADDAEGVARTMAELLDQPL